MMLFGFLRELYQTAHELSDEKFEEELFALSGRLTELVFDQADKFEKFLEKGEAVQFDAACTKIEHEYLLRYALGQPPRSHRYAQCISKAVSQAKADILSIRC